MTKTFFLVEQGCSRMNTPLKLRFRLQMPLLYHPAGYCQSINRLLLDASYPELYEGNPYDWIFLYASQDAYPQDAFRSFMREAYLNKMAPENALH